jgi:hypothetical protein
VRKQTERVLSGKEKQPKQPKLERLFDGSAFGGGKVAVYPIPESRWMYDVNFTLDEHGVWALAEKLCRPWLHVSG